MKLLLTIAFFAFAMALPTELTKPDSRFDAMPIPVPFGSTKPGKPDSTTFEPKPLPEYTTFEPEPLPAGSKPIEKGKPDSRVDPVPIPIPFGGSTKPGKPDKPDYTTFEPKPLPGFTTFEPKPLPEYTTFEPKPLPAGSKPIEKGKPDSRFDPMPIPVPFGSTKPDKPDYTFEPMPIPVPNEPTEPGTPDSSILEPMPIPVPFGGKVAKLNEVRKIFPTFP
ncbi:hypothetical protein FKW77_009380 [Venturia effusa]|uniref:Uncharacterized protein n=1 Tax=Venturia effusa TaxID=50376 RepID=A0A517LBN9_9PEZI|nr:hypothetical protein FKW77_009380 [Venturia effusa]